MQKTLFFLFFAQDATLTTPQNGKWLCCMHPRLRQAIPFPFKGQATFTDLGATI
jgi:hypothetical protein